MRPGTVGRRVCVREPVSIDAQFGCQGCQARGMHEPRAGAGADARGRTGAAGRSRARCGVRRVRLSRGSGRIIAAAAVGNVRHVYSGCIHRSAARMLERQRRLLDLLPSIDSVERCVMRPVAQRTQRRPLDLLPAIGVASVERCVMRPAAA